MLLLHTYKILIFKSKNSSICRSELFFIFYTILSFFMLYCHIDFIYQDIFNF